MIQSSEEVKSEIQIIKDFILLPMLLTVVENMQYKETDHDHEAIMDLIHSDLVKVRMKLRERQIKIWEVDQTRPCLNFEYIRGGYTEKFGLIKTVAKAELSVKLGHYVNQL
jgi:hypothetical protein